MKKIIKNLSKMMVALCMIAVAPIMLASCGNDEETPAHVHEMTHVEAVAPTCTTDGNKEYWHCTGCDKNFDAETNGNEIADVTVKALGHDYTYTYNPETKKYNGVCSHDSTHTDVKDAGASETFPYLVSTEAQLTEVLAIAQNNKYIKLATDINCVGEGSSRINFGGNGQHIMVDLNQKTLATTKRFVFDGNTNIELKNGKFASSDKMAIATVGDAVGDASVLTLVNVEATNTAEKGNGINVYEKGSIILDNSKIVVGGLAIGTNNLWGAQGGETIVVKNNSVVNSTNDAAIFLASFTKTTIENSTIIGNDSALNVLMGTITIKNTTLKSTSTELKVVTTKEQIGKDGSKNHGATPIVIRANWYYDDKANTNKLTLVLENVNFVTATEVNVLVYDGNNEGGMTTGKENLVDQMVEVRKALANVEKVEYYKVNGDAVEKVTQ